MGGKKMEGDEAMKRKRGRAAKEAGKQPSEAGVTSGASKQRHHVERDGDSDEKLEAVQRGEQKQGGDDVPEPLRGKGRSREPRTGLGSEERS